MIWRTILVDQWIDAPVLRAAVADALGVSEGDVAVADEPAEIIAVPEATRVLLERTRQHRAFPTQILAILRDPALERRLDGFLPTLAAATDLAHRLDRTILVDDGLIEPWEMVRVRPDGTADIVAVDSEETGDVDSVVIVGERPLPEVNREAAATTA